MHKYTQYAPLCAYRVNPLNPTQMSLFLCASCDLRAWRLARLLASVIMADWLCMCYTPIDGSNRQWAGCEPCKVWLISVADLGWTEWREASENWRPSSSLQANNSWRSHCCNIVSWSSHGSPIHQRINKIQWIPVANWKPMTFMTLGFVSNMGNMSS